VSNHSPTWKVKGRKRLGRAGHGFLIAREFVANESRWGC